MFGSEEQKEMAATNANYEKDRFWALTEPNSGSDAAFALQCTAEKNEYGWILNGEKKNGVAMPVWLM